MDIVIRALTPKELGSHHTHPHKKEINKLKPMTFSRYIRELRSQVKPASQNQHSQNITVNISLHDQY